MPPMTDRNINAFRDTTAKHKTMSGVTSPTFRCTQCAQTKSVSGRKQADAQDKRHGYICRYCAQAKEAKQCP